MSAIVATIQILLVAACAIAFLRGLAGFGAR
jgi:L-lactate permease